VEGIPAGAGSTSAVAPGVGGAGVDRKCGRPGGALGVSTATCARLAGALNTDLAEPRTLYKHSVR